MGKVFIWIAILGVVIISLIYLVQRSILFPIPNGQLPKSLPTHVEKIELDEGHALFVKSTHSLQERSPLIIYAHGNAELAHWSIEHLSHFTRNGIHLLILEYPGYSGSAGAPSYASIERSSLAAFDRVAGRSDVDRDKIAIYGRSIGGGPACILAAQRRVASLILESTFSSLSALVAEKGFPSFLLRDRFDNEAIVSELAIPVFIYHGTNDTLIPHAHGKRLYETAKEGIFKLGDCGHNNCPRPWPDIDNFLQSSWSQTSYQPTPNE